MFKLRDYQEDLSNRAVEIIITHGFVYLAMQVRTGKTFTSLSVCDKMGAKNVLFVTKKKAISSIESDYKTMGPGFKITIINYESLHKVSDTGWDVMILDEAHRLGAFPKAGQATVEVKTIVQKSKPRVILMSGTPTPESYSQMYHQVYSIPDNPFCGFTNFYKFAREFVNIQTRKIAGFDVNDYSDGQDRIVQLMDKYTLKYTQEEAGFVSTIKENTLTVEMEERTYRMIARLKKDKVLEGSNDVVLGDTAVKLMTKVHQMYSGTVKSEDGNIIIFDKSKANYIKEAFCLDKIAIFYKFQGEYDCLKSVFGDGITNDLVTFNEDPSINIALQIQAGREGISLARADYLVYYNIDFSATSYWQSRDRMTTMDRPENIVFWVFAKGGIEEKIYKVVLEKKNFTTRHFKAELL